MTDQRANSKRRSTCLWIGKTEKGKEKGKLSLCGELFLHAGLKSAPHFQTHRMSYNQSRVCINIAKPNFKFSHAQLDEFMLEETTSKWIKWKGTIKHANSTYMYGSFNHIYSNIVPISIYFLLFLVNFIKASTHLRKFVFDIGKKRIFEYIILKRKMRRQRNGNFR